MGLIRVTIFFILAWILGGLTIELFTDQNWLRALVFSLPQVIVIVLFAWVIKGRIRNHLSDDEINAIFSGYDELGIRAGVCEGCGKEMIIEFPSELSAAIVAEVVANFCRIGDMTFSHSDGDLLHFKIG